MGCGELSAVEFEDFLRTTLGHAAHCSHDGSIHFVCMHWGKIRELLAAAADLFAETKNLCVWNMSNAGMGSLYRSKHELIFVFKKGAAPHVNNIELGRFGRHRTERLALPEPLRLKRYDKEQAVAAPHGQAGCACRRCDTGLLQPQRHYSRSFRRRWHHVDRRREDGTQSPLDRDDPRYVDVTIKRWQNLAGRTAVRADAATPHPDDAPPPAPDAAVTMAAPKQANDGADL